MIPGRAMGEPADAGIGPRRDSCQRLPEEIYQDAVRFREAAATARACLLRGHLSLAGWRMAIHDRRAATPADALAMARRIDAINARRWDDAPRDSPPIGPD